MKTKALFVLVLFSMLLIWSCSEHTVQPYQPPLANGRVVGSIHGVVSDFCSHALFDSAEVIVSWVSNGEVRSTVTNRLGYYIITGLVSGDYVITFSGASEWSISRISVTVPELEDILDCCPPTDSSYHHSVTQNVNLYKKNAGLKGRIYKKESALSTTVAEGVTVVADYTYSFSLFEHDTSFYSYGGYNVYPGKFTTTTNSEGYFFFEDLPGTPTVVLYTMPYTYNTFEWGMEFNYAYLIQDATYTLEDCILEIATPEPFIRYNNFIDVYKFVISDNIFATFSRLMRSYCFGFELSYYDGDYWEIVECDTSWEGDITLTIDPYVDLRPGTEYKLRLSGFSQDDHEFNQVYTFFTQRGIEFVSTNLERAQGFYDQFPIDSNIEVTFSMRINLNHPDTYVAIFDSTGHYVYYTLSHSADGKTLTISHPEDLEPGHVYILDFVIYSNITDTPFRFRTASDLQAPAVVTGFIVNMGAGWNADWNTTMVNFFWNSVANAASYHIFATDNYQNSDRVHLGEFTAQDFVTSQTGGVTLPAQFDYYTDDPTQTPFLYSTQVTFYIVPFNAAGMGPLSSPVTISDGTNPSPLLSNQSATADSAGNPSAKTITIDMTSTTGEYLTSVTFSMTESGGDAAYVLPSSAITYVWNTTHYNKTGCTVTLAIPADRNAAGDTITVNTVDTSGRTGAHSLTLQ